MSNLGIAVSGVLGARAGRPGGGCASHPGGIARMRPEEGGSAASRHIPAASRRAARRSVDPDRFAPREPDLQDTVLVVRLHRAGIHGRDPHRGQLAVAGDDRQRTVDE